MKKQLSILILLFASSLFQGCEKEDITPSPVPGTVNCDTTTLTPLESCEKELAYLGAVLVVEENKSSYLGEYVFSLSHQLDSVMILLQECRGIIQ